MIGKTIFRFWREKIYPSIMFAFNRFSLRGFDWVFLATVFFLIAIGFAVIYSVDLSRGSELVYTKKQLVAFAIGMAVLIVASFSKHSLFRNYSKWLYFLSLILLVAVLLFGRTIRGTTGWFDLGAFSFQPVEVAKVGVILMLAYIISRFGREHGRPLFFFGTGALALIPIILVLLQPDLGSAALLGIIWFALIWLTGTKRTYIFIFFGSLALLAVFSWFFLLQDYQKDRLLTFVDPSRDPLGSGYNVIQSTIAVGSGQLTGRGLGFGSQSQLRFLPETQTDFVFSVVGEELGLAGVIVILGLFGVLFWRLFVLVRKTDDEFIALTASGIIVLFFAQFFINIGSSVGLLPVTGITLPFVSYGGSSLIINMFLVGLVESLARKESLR